MNQTQVLEMLDRYIRARYPIVATLSHEEVRVLSGIRELVDRRNVAEAKKAKQENRKPVELKVAEYSITSGLTGEGFDPDSTKDPIPALEAMLQTPTERPTLFVMKDFHGMLDRGNGSFDPLMTRYLRDIAAKFSTCKHTLILLSPAFSIPPDLEKTIVMIDWPLPDTDELTAILNKAEMDLPQGFPVTLNGSRAALVASMAGLTEFEAESVLMSGIIATRGLGDNIIPFVVKEKAQIIRKAGVLEYFPETVTMSEVGGLEYLKDYAAETMEAFSQKAQDFGMKTPRGVLLVGIPGTGKSLAAKAIAGGRMPLLRMDVGALMGGLVGQSEGNMRAALKVAEAVAPCILWVDELEKAIGGDGGEMDGGTSKRVFGTLLTWMQEKTAPVYVVATANDIRGLKAELIRRFDDMIWVDLPNCADRIEILKIHLGKCKQDAGRFDLQAIAGATWGFSGGEIEKTINAAMKRAFRQKTELTTGHLLEAAGRVTPIAITMKDQIESLRKQATNALQAGEPLEEKPREEGSRKLDLSDL